MTNEKIKRDTFEYFFTGKLPENKPKMIWDYFNERIDNPDCLAYEIMPYGVLWQDAFPSVFFDAFLNKIVPLKLWLLDDNTPDDKELNIHNSHVKNKFPKGTKKELKDFVLNGGSFTHTNLIIFEDNLILLGKIESEDNTFGLNQYMFMLLEIYDKYGGQLGRFETEDTPEQVAQSIVNTLEDPEFWSGSDLECDPLKPRYTELPIGFLQGHLSYQMYR